MKQLDIITDLQFGSTGKGLLAGWLAERNNYDTIVTAWSPNAGHTYIDSNGVKFVNTAIPNGIVSDGLKRILIGPGSVIDPDAFMAEMEKYALYLDGVDIMIHENAAVVMPTHRAEEARSMFKIGSTMKGVGAAVIDKIKRDPSMNIIARDALVSTPLEGCVVSAQLYNHAVDKAEYAMLEGAQGFSLSINQGFYPFTTSRDCTVHQLLSDCAIPRHAAGSTRVIGCARTYPIRVANRFDADGKMIGTSGPCYDDQNEIEWERLGMAPELTTVTKLPRRIFTFSAQQIREAVRMNGVDEIFLNFVNYIEKDNHPKAWKLGSYLDAVAAAGSKVTTTGWGPSAFDVEGGFFK
jgi:adenylosuccinate synthase